MSNQPTIQFPKPLRVNLHRDMTPPRVKIECGDIVVADCIGNPDHAERIVACVNACAGIADPQAAIQIMRELRDALEAVNYIDLSPCNGGSCMVATNADDSLDDIKNRAAPLLTKAKEVLG